MTLHVAVVGAGPVGCVAAATLAERGVPVTLFEAERELPRELRASTFHPATLELLRPFGVVDELISRGLVAERFAYRPTPPATRSGCSASSTNCARFCWIASPTTT